MSPSTGDETRSVDTGGVPSAKQLASGLCRDRPVGLRLHKIIPCLSKGLQQRTGGVCLTCGKEEDSIAENSMTGKSSLQN